MRRLHVPKRRKFYEGDCASTAIAAIVNKRVEAIPTARRMLVDGMMDFEVSACLKKHDLLFSYAWIEHKPESKLLGQYLRPGMFGIISVRVGPDTAHMVAVEDLLVFDNNTDEQVMWVHDHPLASHRVRSIWWITRRRKHRAKQSTARRNR